MTVISAIGVYWGLFVRVTSFADQATPQPTRRPLRSSFSTIRLQS
jgi:uncharacterized membrane protein